jgi:pantothenate kinase
LFALAQTFKMNALLNIIPNLISLIKELPLKNKMIILVMLITLGGGYLFYDRYLDFKLATLDRPVPSLVQNEKEVSTPEKVQRITPKVVNVTAKGTE